MLFHTQTRARDGKRTAQSTQTVNPPEFSMTVSARLGILPTGFLIPYLIQVKKYKNKIGLTAKHCECTHKSQEHKTEDIDLKTLIWFAVSLSVYENLKCALSMLIK